MVEIEKSRKREFQFEFQFHGDTMMVSHKGTTIKPSLVYENYNSITFTLEDYERFGCI